MPDHFSEECEQRRRALQDAQQAHERALKRYIDAQLFGSTPLDRALDDLQQADRAKKEAEERLGECAEQSKTATLDEFEFEVFGRVKPHQEQEILEILGRIPAGHKRGLRKITLRPKPSSQPEPVLDERTGARVLVEPAGEYDRGSRSIVQWYPPNASTMKHEIGHHVFYQRLTEQQRTDWQNFWEQHREQIPRDHGKRNYWEGFAVVYEVYFDNREKLPPAVREKMKPLLEGIS